MFNPRRVRFEFVRAALIAILTVSPIAAKAGAWTLPAGDTQIISGAIYSTATESFDDSGGAVPTFSAKFCSSRMRSTD
jgi:hypothetical protein